MADSRSAARKGTGQFHLVRGGKSDDKPAGTIDYYDYNLLTAVILLIAFGMVMLYSTSAYTSEFSFVRKQALISIAGIAGMLFFSRFDYHILTKLAWGVYILAMFLQFITKFVGREVNGAKRWLGTDQFSFQPAEVAKLAVIILLPMLIIEKGRKFRKPAEAAKVAFPGLLAAFFAYVFTENLSTAIIIAGITIGLIIIVYPRPRKLVITLAVLVGVVIVASLILKSMNLSIDANSESFRINRILVWLNPQAHADKGGYQIMQALYAIGSGGFFGKGLGNSTQKLGAIPEAQNDMIFSIICEELGVFGAALVLMLFAFLLWRLAVIAENAPDLYGSLIVIGVFIHIALQVIFNIAVVLNLLPTTGITLPFISYGGTAMFFLMAEMAIALSVSNQITLKGQA